MKNLLFILVLIFAISCKKEITVAKDTCGFIGELEGDYVGMIHFWDGQAGMDTTYFDTVQVISTSYQNTCQIYMSHFLDDVPVVPTTEGADGFRVVFSGDSVHHRWTLPNHLTPSFESGISFDGVKL